MTAYRQRMNEERLAAQAAPVQAAAKAILQQFKNIEHYLHWSLDPAEKDGGAYYAQNLLEHAHELVDLAHSYRAALKANPPPKEEDETDGNEIPSIS